MPYQVAEKFKAIQGEGFYAGTPMAFIRFAGCSVGKTICHHCDTDFNTTFPWKGGGEFTAAQLLEWAGDYEHICLTGGEPLNQDLHTLFGQCRRKMIHIETSGTVEWEVPFLEMDGGGPRFSKVFMCVSPKPGYIFNMLQRAQEIKVIAGGLGNGEGWPTLEDALEWAKRWPQKPVYLQPRNRKFEPDRLALAHAVELVKQHPQLRLSVQLHKFIGER